MNKSSLLAVLVLSSAVLLAGCDDSRPQSTAQQNAVAVEQNQQRLQKAIPAPQLQTSLERQNLRDRLERLNSQNMSGYIYLLSYGRVVAQYPVKGKVTSLNAYLMAEQKVERFDGGANVWNHMMIEQPDYDGAYGENDGGIFFFTADTNAYVEWRGDYMFSDTPIRLQEQPLMTREVK